MQRYPDCQLSTSRCAECSLSSYGHDCHGNPCHPLAYYRKLAGLTQEGLALGSGVHLRAIQRAECGERELGGMAARTVNELAKALRCTVEDLIT